ncbi:MAG: hypothetical protein WAZ12_05120 [Candidatus Absconditicoccaceae bacterium]
MKILGDIEIKNDSGNKVMSLLSSANSRFHWGKKILGNDWNIEVKSKIVANNNIKIIDRENIDQIKNHFKIRLYFFDSIKYTIIVIKKIRDI